jgi:hypothetical protein
MRGQKGDASVLKPTLMCVVPLILDRIYKNIIDSVNKRGTSFQKVFEFCYRSAFSFSFPLCIPFFTPPPEVGSDKYRCRHHPFFMWVARW